MTPAVKAGKMTKDFQLDGKAIANKLTSDHGPIIGTNKRKVNNSLPSGWYLENQSEFGKKDEVPTNEIKV